MLLRNSPVRRAERDAPLSADVATMRGVRCSTGSRRCCRAACCRRRRCSLRRSRRSSVAGRARLYPGGRTATARAASLINGSASHTVEFDDIYRDAIYHPACPTISAALAAAEARGASGDRFLRAVVVGYEVSTRIGRAVVPAHYKFWHTTGTVGCFGSAAAVATVLGLDETRTMHALATAATFAAGLQQAFRSEAMSKPLHAGRAAEAGLLAAFAPSAASPARSTCSRARPGSAPRWVARRAGSARPKGSAATTTSRRSPSRTMPAAAIPSPRSTPRWRCAARTDLDPRNVRRVRVATYQTALDVTGRASSGTPFEAKFSLPFVVASALVHGSVRLDGFTPERLADPLVGELMGRVEIVADQG